MFAVIFRATINNLDTEYRQLAQQLRDVALSRYGCVEFVSSSEGDQETAISYWTNEADITRWREDPVHQQAQRLGREKWYRDYKVEVVEIKRSYSSERSIS
ncbi:antibiotic biosynthesis monooxygenase family protein [Vibrio parahaemolyticus]|uniref:antibiotic biosynthesis monooxygenase family protein n=1 Tax=Vibrio mediterranei TaxID=689 RepID=UPI00406888A2